MNGSCGSTLRVGPAWTPLVRAVLAALVGLYVLQLLVEHWAGVPVTARLAWWGPGSGLFQPWQPVTSFLLNGPDPVGAVISWVVLWFFLPPAEGFLGRRRLLGLLALSWVGAVGATLPLQLAGVIQGGGPYLGIHCFLTALLVVFGLSVPDARILLFFVIPVRASWVAWGTGLVSLLFFLYSRALGSSIAFFGWAAAVAWMLGAGRVDRWLGRFRRRRPARRFGVIEGQRGRGPGDWVH
jgi:hypothetical protein